MKYLAMMKDPQGLTRAWGLADDREVAKIEALRQLDSYRQKKAMLGDPLATAAFSVEVEELPEDTDD